MKNIRTISRGNNGVALQFAAKKSSSEIQYGINGFNFTAPIYVNGVEVSGADLQDQIDTLEADLIVANTAILALQGEIATLQTDYTALEGRVTALENA